MIKKEKGIALVSLIITIAVMTIVASTVIYVSLDRFEINNLRKMYNDIELLQDKVSNYHLKYGVLPILRDSTNVVVQYSYTELNFSKNSADNEVYYILDLKAMEGISLNYGEKGFQNPNTSDDVYIINEKSNTIYYVKGVVLGETRYHTLKNNNSSINDTIPPSSPQINVISGTQKTDEDGNIYYTTDVEIEIIPGKDGTSGVAGTKYSLDNGTTWNDIGNSRQIFEISESGTYVIKAKSLDEAGNYSAETIIEIEISIPNTAIPSSPRIVDSHEVQDKNTRQYKTGTEIIIYAGNNSVETEYSLDNGGTWNKFTNSSKTITIMNNGTYPIIARSWNEAGQYSEASTTIRINADIEESFKIGSYVKYDVQYTDMYALNSSYGNYDATSGWRYFGTNEEGKHLIVSTGIPMILSTGSANEASEKWWDLDAEDERYKIENGLLNNIPNIPYEKVEQGTITPSNINTMIGLFEGTTRTDTNNESYIAVGDYFKSSTYASKIEKVTTFTEEDVIRTVVNVTKVELDDMYLGDESYKYSEDYAYYGCWYFTGVPKGVFNLNYEANKRKYTWKYYVANVHMANGSFWRNTTDG